MNFPNVICIHFDQRSITTLRRHLNHFVKYTQLKKVAEWIEWNGNYGFGMANCRVIKISSTKPKLPFTHSHSATTFIHPLGYRHSHIHIALIHEICNNAASKYDDYIMSQDDVLCSINQNNYCANRRDEFFLCFMRN